MDKKHKEISRRMMLASTLLNMPPRQQLYIPHIDGVFYRDLFIYALSGAFIIGAIVTSIKYMG